MRSTCVAVLLGSVLAAADASAGVVLLSQERSIRALSTFDGSSASVSASDFAPFVQSVGTSAEFPTVIGGTALNTANSTINCLVDPNAIRVTGSLSAAGGLAIVGGVPEPVFGEAGAVVVVTFEVLAATDFQLTCLPRPSSTPGDEFELEFGYADQGPTFVRINQDDAAQFVNLSGTLAPGQYTLQYRVELTRDDSLTDVQYGLQLVVPAPATFSPAIASVLWIARRRRPGITAAASRAD